MGKHKDLIMQKIAILTSGGDAPGMNAAIRAAVRACCARGLQAIGVRRGYNGLIENDLQLLGARYVANILQRGGTMLLTARSIDAEQAAEWGLVNEVVDDGAMDFAIARWCALLCANAFNLKGRWGFCWALTCSRSRLDAFGGGAQLLDLGARKSLAWIDCSDWLGRGLAGADLS